MSKPDQGKHFAARVLRWFDAHGRKDLPWQRDVAPYRTWISEIMLQQTQVATVIPYFERFMQRFPDVEALANAPEDDVLEHWSGLGYYARARNLHRAARIVRDEFAGRFPDEFDAVAALPGIGRSTAGAILSLAFRQRHAILDGNVKRVLARHAGIDGWPGTAAVANALWSVAEARLPGERFDAYNQAMMDLGATLCTRSRPQCETCPVSADCVARLEHRQQQLPGRKPKKALPEKRVDMLMIEHNGCLLLEKRPPSGIWGGLWSLPESDDGETFARETGGGASIDALGELVHTFSHYRLRIRPLHVRLAGAPAMIGDRETRWHDLGAPLALGVAAPVRQLIETLAQHLNCGERDGTHG